MIERLLPDTVASAETLGEDPTACLLPEEEQLVTRAVEKRRREVTLARTCARRALTDLGRDAVAVLSGPRREPLWPGGIVGSITHCEGYCAAAVAEHGPVTAVGIDAEVADVLPDGVLDYVSSPGERALLEKLPQDRHWDRILFSAKESVYKAWFPLTGRWLGFEDAVVSIDPVRETFRADLLVEPPVAQGRTLSGFDGRFLAEQGLVMTAVTVASNRV
ncbi:4'-phosphopantetheinyl transferase EntD [Halopolyspora algeriensis]|uniref:4'-phosphopantetheinyl transferase EntD n=1 Tax=Halopolyspora algeriensis TaxID=1500506 RepID=A0A368VIA4_9ACTN|nr:4'-phosphopantetheinyl transferase superfamily protein [Halopolyspora algeriensis]RCW40394.1 4'-phosphopantetheinyl transferase EntD [Halopolyspora algeriensis]TQM53678.1 4'-phosphopantetheinyl transferase EntD [Halopolyspora algeriensis]